jgi:hypothetical protein
MSIGQSLGIQGVLLGSFILAAFGWIVSANAAPLPPLPSVALNAFDSQSDGAEGNQGGLLPPMVERLTNST